MEGFGIGIEWTGDAVQLRVRGELDIATADRLVERVAAVRESSARVVLLDLQEVSFMDSSGLRALLDAQRVAEDGHDCRVVVVRAPAAVRDVIGITGAGSLLRLAPDVATALGRPA